VKVLIDGIEYTPNIPLDGKRPFSDIVKECREKLGVSLDKVAADTGLSKGQLWQLERKDVDPRLSTVKTILRYYGVKFEDIE